VTGDDGRTPERRNTGTAERRNTGTTEQRTTERRNDGTTAVILSRASASERGERIALQPRQFTAVTSLTT
jgi:hypothetical protein